MARILVGTSGYLYRDWRKVLYPPGLGTGRWLQRYASVFPTLELNTTFYRLTTAVAAARWRDATPPGFVFTAKGSRYITHMKKLKDPAAALERFFAPLEPLRPKLAVVLWQLPPRFDVDALPRLDAFLAALPPGLRYAVEFREPSWYLPETCDGARRARRGLLRARPPPARPAPAHRWLPLPPLSRRGREVRRPVRPARRSPRSPVTSSGPVAGAWTPTSSSTTTSAVTRSTTR